MQSSTDPVILRPVFRQGDVVWAQFPLTDKTEKYKRRPVLVISNNSSNEIDQDYIVLPITKKVRDESFSIRINPGDVSGNLPEASELRCNKPFTIREQRIDNIIGVLARDKMVQAIRLVLEAIQM